MTKAALAKAVADMSRIVEEWKGNEKKITARIADANLRVAQSEDLRKRFALTASLGDPEAAKEITKARAQHAAAEGDLHDLNHALNDAKLRITEAEREAKIARNNLAKFEAEVLMRKRVEVAGELDAVIAEFAALYGEYAELGREIANSEGALPRNMIGMVNHEGAIGLRRVAAALPTFFLSFFPGALHDEQKKEPLAITEARHWNLAPVETTTPKAA